MKTLLSYLVLSLACIAPLGCNSTSDVAPEADGPAAVSLQLNWYPEAEHGGYYAGLVHKHYGEEGLNVEIRPGGPNSNVALQVATGRAMFGVTNGDDILLARAQEMEIVALLAAFQNTAACIIVHADSGIESLAELGKVQRLAANLSAPYLDYLKAQVDLSGIEIVAYTGNIQPFLDNKNSAQQGYVISEPFLIRAAGGDPKPLPLSGAGYSPYGSVLFTSQEVVREQPELVRKMVRAALRGWQQYLKEPGQTNEHIRQVNPEMTLEALQFGATEVRNLVQPNGQGKIGDMQRERWARLADQLQSTGQIEASKVNIDKTFTVEFLGE